MDGAEAAPVEFFIGNTNPRATPEIISEVLKKCAKELPEKVDLEVINVKYLTNPERDPNPRTRSWRVTVPCRFREFMLKDDLYYAGWAHRPYYPPKQNRAKRHQADPNDPVTTHLAAGRYRLAIQSDVRAFEKHQPPRGQGIDYLLLQ